MISLEGNESLAIAPNRLHQMKRFDPLEILPQEVWTLIIVGVASEGRSNSQVIISQEVLLDLLHVSSHWETIILSNSVLWSDIVVENSHDAAARIAIGLHYSKMVSLSLYIYPPIGCWAAVSETILLNKGRITKLYLDNSHDLDFLSILADLGPLESLTSIHFGGSPSSKVKNKVSYLSGLPIQWVDNLIFTKETLQQLDARQLRNVSIKEDLDAVASTLERFENLLDVEINPKGRNHAIQNSRIQYQTRRLPWKTLRYRNRRAELLDPMIGQLSGLVSLEVTLHQKPFETLIPLVYLLEKLERFEMQLRENWGVFDLPPIRKASNGVKKLVLHSHIAKPDVHQLLAQVIFQCFPHVQDFLLTIWRDSLIQIYLPDHGFRYIASLAITTLMPQMDRRGHAKQLPPTLKRLAYYNHKAMPTWLPFYSPGITHLNVFSLVSNSIEMHSPAWPALQALEVWCTTRITWKGPVFQHLWFISLVYSARQLADNATKLCRDIALHPDYLPALRKLKLEVCPEWDILLILLEGRNIATSPGIARITSLEIPSRCPPFILEHFRGLIEGNATGEVSYYSVSVASAYEIARDTSIPGCAECHRALRFCIAPVKSNYEASSIERFDYPNSPLKILRSWEVRAGEWYPFMSKQRVDQCTRKFPLVLLSDCFDSF